MHRSTRTLVFAGAFGVLAGALALASDTDSSFDRIVGRYEVIRQALLHDTVDGVADAASAIGVEAEALEAASTEDGLRELLPALRGAAVDLESATDLESARAAFGTLSKAMVRFRRLVAEPEPVVVFCSMAQGIWLQPKGEIGNPYYGQSMAKCGEVVSD